MYIDIEKWFTYHTPDEDQKRRYDMIRLKAKELAYIIEQVCPDSLERSIALVKLREVNMFANNAISLEKAK